MKRIIIGAIAACALAVPAAAAAVEPATVICVPEAAGKPVLSPEAGETCKALYRKKAVTELGGAEAANHLTYAAEPTAYGKEPTILVNEGVNLALSNGLKEHGGNLLLGPEPVKAETVLGANNIVLGSKNTVNGEASIVGGSQNVAKGNFDVLLSGSTNLADQSDDVILNGSSNEVPNEKSFDTIAGGTGNVIRAANAFIGGGRKNLVEEPANFAAIFGGKEVKAKVEYEAIP